MTRTLDLDTLRLASGSHKDHQDAMCVMEAVAYVAGEPWSDHPECACPVLTGFMVPWNDSLDDEDRQKLKPYIPRLVGTLSTPEVEARRGRLASDWLIRTFTPAWLRLAGLDSHADAIEALGDTTHLSADEIRERVVPIIEAAESAARSAAASAARLAADSAADSAAHSAARLAAYSAADSAAYSAARSAAASAARLAADSAADSAAHSAAHLAAHSAARSAADSAAYSAARSAARSAAYSAADSAADSAARSAAHLAARLAARSAAYSAAREALQPTAHLLQTSAFALLDQLLAVTPEVTP